jgi:hypothetical protein
MPEPINQYQKEYIKRVMLSAFEGILETIKEIKEQTEYEGNISKINDLGNFVLNTQFNKETAIDKALSKMQNEIYKKPENIPPFLPYNLRAAVDYFIYTLHEYNLNSFDDIIF